MTFPYVIEWKFNKINFQERAGIIDFDTWDDIDAFQVLCEVKIV